ncbi:MAG TPA: hypothetical protein VEB21_13515, partial [Terriglobales bacterium]|nr:hypothetical protein [Terriglobales bacterium]
AADGRCPAGRTYLYIDPQGRSWPCAYTKGKTTAIDLLGDDWKEAAARVTPCNRCIVGPMLEFNLLAQHPLRAGWETLRTYG